MPSKSSVHCYRRGTGSYYSQKVQVIPSNYMGILVLTDSVTSDGPIANYRRKIANHEDATSSLEGVRYTWNRGDGNGHSVVRAQAKSSGIVYNDYAWFQYGITAPPGDPALALRTLAENKAATAFYKKLESTKTLFQGGTALAELGETLRMIRSPLKGLRKGLDDYLSDVTKRRKGSPASKQKALADTWLEHSFGWMPLVNDIEEGMSYLDRRKKQLENETIPITAIAKAEDTLFTPMSGSTVLTSYGCLKTYKYRVSVRYKGAIWSNRQSQTIATPESLGLGLRNFAPTLWEIMPYSFLVDYFTNVGDVISAYSLRKTKLAWGCRTERWETVLSSSQPWQAMATNNYNVLSWLSSPPSGDTSKVTVKRSRVTSVPVPDLYFEVPGLGTKWLNLAALAASKRRLTPF